MSLGGGSIILHQRLETKYDSGGRLAPFHANNILYLRLVPRPNIQGHPPLFLLAFKLSLQPFYLGMRHQ